jgi:DNA-binding transcriptional MerR regulator
MMRVRRKGDLIRSPIYLELMKSGFLSIEELSDICSLHPDLVEKYMEIGLITPSVEILDEPYFSTDAIFRLKKIQRLRRDLGVNLIGIEIILNLLDEMEDLRDEIRDLRRWRKV